MFTKMDKRLKYGLVLGVILALIVATGALAKVWTDKEDYAPGETVTIYGDNSDGAGYQAGETVHVDVTGPNGYTASCEGVADDNGTWSCQVTLWDTYLAWGDYFYTATGQLSGVSGSGTFTDALNTDSYASNCNTQQDNFTSGSTVCIKLTGLGNNASGTIKWWAPGLNPATDPHTRSTNYGPVNGNTSDSFQVSACGTWNVIVTANEVTGGTPDFDDSFNVTGCSPANTTPTVTANDQSFDEGAATVYSASWSDPDADQSHSCTIDFGDGSGTQAGTVDPAQPSTAGTCSASHTYADGLASYTITVSVSDGTALGSDTATTTVNNVAPTVTLSGDASADEGQTKSYSYTTSDPGAETFSHTAICGSNGTLSNDSFNNATGAGSFDCTFPDGPASSTVSVTVDDGDGGKDSDSIDVTVTNVDPVVAEPSWVSASVACRTPATLTNISFNDAGLVDYPWDLNIDWGDGSTDTDYSTNVQGDQADQSHTYNTPGSFSAIVTVTDKDDGSGSNTSTSLSVYQTYTVDFLPPFDDSSPSGLIVNKMKNGRVVPVKVTIYDDCAQAYVTDPAAIVTILVTKTSGTGTGDPIEEYADAGQSSAGTNLFRWTTDTSAPGGGFWIYNLDSKALGLVINNLYRVDAWVGTVKATVSRWAVLQPVK